MEINFKFVPMTLYRRPLGKYYNSITMRRFLLLLSLFIFDKAISQNATSPMKDKFVLVIHGGAGTILKSQMKPDKEMAYNAALDSALQKGYDILKKGGTALDAVE